MKKSLLLYLIAPGLLMLSTINARVVFKEQGKESYEDLVERANQKDVAALQELGKAWQGEANKFAHIGKYLTENGYSKKESKEKLIPNLDNKGLSELIKDDIHNFIQKNHNSLMKISESTKFTNVLKYFSKLLKDAQDLNNNAEEESFEEELKEIKDRFKNLKAIVKNPKSKLAEFYYIEIAKQEAIEKEQEKQKPEAYRLRHGLI